MGGRLVALLFFRGVWRVWKEHVKGRAGGGGGERGHAPVWRRDVVVGCNDVAWLWLWQ